MTPSQISEIQQRADAATKGPWVYMGDTFPYQGMVVSAKNVDRICETPIFDDRTDDMEFIAHARKDIPNLLAHISEQAEKIGRLEAATTEVLESRESHTGDSVVVSNYKLNRLENLIREGEDE